MTISRKHLVVCLGLAVAQSAAEVLVEPAVLEAVGSGPSRVIIELSLDDGFSPEGNLTEQNVRQQREAIGRAQQKVLSELDATEARLIRRPVSAPFLALEVTLKGLATLQAMPDRVIRVYEDDTSAPSDEEAFPHER